MKNMNNLDNLPSNYFTKSSRTKYEDEIITSKIEDYQTSMSTFSAKFENKISLSSSTGKSKGKKKVEFNPLITVINIQSYKRENYNGPEDNDNNSKKIKKCITCNIY